MTGDLLYHDKPLTTWLDLLTNGDDTDRQKAATALMSTATALTKTVLPALLSLSKQAAGPARAEVAEALGKVGERVWAFIPLCRAALKDMVVTGRDETVRSAALKALVEIDPQTKSRVPALAEALQDDLPYVRLTAAFALKEMGSEAKAAVAPLTKVSLYDPDPRVRLEAAVALWKIERRTHGVIPILVRALQQPDELLHWIAADCLGEMGPAASDAVPALVQALGRPINASLIRTGMILALERIDPAAARIIS
jgi:HEAT repeat protein